MKTITIQEAKTNLLWLIEEACRGEEIIIARGTQLRVRLVPIMDVKGNRKPGSMKGKFVVGPEFFEPLPPDELDAWGQ